MAALLPVRLFLALGWLRAGVEKAIEPSWWRGDGLRSYLAEQLTTGAVTITPYRAVMDDLWRPLATPLGIAVLATQLLVGLALLVGYRTRAALTVGIVLNVQFILAGSVDPSVFYLVLAIALFAVDPADLPGVDQLRAVDPPWRWTVPRPSNRTLGVATGIVAVAGAALLPFVRTIDPARVVEDPAVILLTVTGMAVLTAILRRSRA